MGIVLGGPPLLMSLRWEPVMSTTTLPTSKASEHYEVAGSSIASDTRPEDRKPWTVNERSLFWLALLATGYTLYAARSLLLPIAIAITLALLLRPLVTTLSRRIPRGLAALVALIAVVAFFALVISPVVSKVRELGLTDPDQISQYTEDVKERFKPVLSIYKKVQDASDQLDGTVSPGEAAASEQAAVEEPSFRMTVSGAGEDKVAIGLPGGQAVKVPEETEISPVRSQPLAVRERREPLIGWLGSAANALANTVLVVILLYFLLAAGDELIGNVVRLTPGVQEKKRMEQLVGKVERGVSKYLFTITGINAGLGVAIGAAMWLLGMPAPWLIGFMAFVFNFVPYVGAIVGMLISGAVAILFFDAGEPAFLGLSGQAMWGLVPACYFLLTNLEGNLVTPTLLGQTMKLNPVLVFLSLVFWGWLWGIGGALLAVPLLAVIRIWCGHFESTRGFAAILGD